MNVKGLCHICGEYRTLTFEHIPPRSAFNHHPVLYKPFIDTIRQEPNAKESKWKTQQKGMGGHTLCQKCNNDTGSWYAKDFAQWTYQGMRILDLSSGRPALFYPNYIYPLRVLKQIIAMFLSSAQPGFIRKHPDLQKFILFRYQQYLPPRYHVYTYYYKEGILRNSGFIVKGKIRDPITLASDLFPMIEIAFPPFGYLMTIDSRAEEPRLAEISHFSRYRYDDFRHISVKMTALPTHLFYPGDYREEDEIPNSDAEPFE